ncbi:MAG TPA: 30S ribosomal protein S18 [Patescibacteria group bacterium]|nr:30S ribosomal protein S18 [Patescibacteria group bacterium]
MKNKICVFCSKGIKEVDYKQVEVLKRSTSFLGKIETRRRTGACAYHQRRLAQAIKRARHLALVPYINR